MATSWTASNIDRLWFGFAGGAGWSTLSNLLVDQFFWFRPITHPSLWNICSTNTHNNNTQSPDDHTFVYSFDGMEVEPKPKSPQPKRNQLSNPPPHLLENVRDICNVGIDWLELGKVLGWKWKWGMNDLKAWKQARRTKTCPWFRLLIINN